MQLTDEQRRIIHHRGGHARVSAVAGSGKTTTMVARIGHLLQEGVRADEILVLMFNKSARDTFAHKMRHQLSSFAGPLPEVRTFHSLGLRLVNSFTRRAALPQYTLITEEYILEKLARQTAGAVFREEREEEGWLAGEEVEEFLTFIDRVKSAVSGADAVFRQGKLATRYSYFIRAFELFEKVRQERRIRFYADLIYEPLLAMLADDQLAAWVADRVDHIIVDEYQDINEAQQQLLKIVAGKRARVMAVGDVDQCIYEWRGARPEYITSKFQRDFPQPANYQLSHTFRYGHQLSLAANHLISTNRKRDQKLCISHRENPHTTITCLEEKKNHPVVTMLAEWRSRGRKLSEAVVLVRLFAQSVPVELALLEAEIPYRLEGNAQVFDCPEVLALTGYLNLVAGSLSDEDPETREKMVQAMLSQPHLGMAREDMAALVGKIAESPDNGISLLRQGQLAELPPFLRKRMTETADNWQWLVNLDSTEPADALLKRIVQKLNLYDFYHNFSARAATAENRIKTCQAFIDFAAAQNLSVHALLARADSFRGSGASTNRDELLITSVHRAKGLEWPLVILPGLEDGSFPFLREKEGEADTLEDERRLFYVALTRAIERLVCVYPPDAALKSCIARCSGKPPGKTVRASRFLYEANPGLSIRLGEALAAGDKDQKITADDTTVAEQYLASIGAAMPLTKSESIEVRMEVEMRKPLQINEIAEGLRVWHQAFGAGTVIAVKDRLQGRLLVHFDDHGEMILLVGYAKLLPLASLPAG